MSLRLVKRRVSPAELHAYSEDRKAEESLRADDEPRGDIAAWWVLLAISVAIFFL